MKRTFKQHLQEANREPSAIVTLRKIVNGGSYKAVKLTDGQVTVDLTTANMLLTVYDNIKDKTKFDELLNTKAGFSKLVDIGWKVVRK